MNTVTVSSDYGIAAGVDLVFASAPANGFNVFLPDPAQQLGRQIVVRRVDTNTNVNVSVNVKGPVDGVPYRQLWTRDSYLTVVSDGVAWRMVAQSPITPLGIFYVSGIRGNDLYHGRSWEQPFKSIMAAVAAANAGATIHVDAGVYVETVDLTGRSRLRLEGVKGGIGLGSVIKAPTTDAACVRVTAGIASGAIVRGFTLRGSGAGWNGHALHVEKCSQCVFEDMTIANPDGTVSAKPKVDPITAGVGIWIQDCEHTEIHNVFVQEFRQGLVIASDATVGNSMHILHKVDFSRCYQEMSIPLVNGQVLAGHIRMDGVKCVNPMGDATTVYSADLAVQDSTFIACEWTEGGPNRKVRFQGNHNVFVNCDNANNTTVYLEGNGNTLQSWFNQKKMVVNGHWNLIDRMHGRGGSSPILPGNPIQLEVNGNDNAVLRSLRDTNPQGVITGTGQRTRIDT